MKEINQEKEMDMSENIKVYADLADQNSANPDLINQQNQAENSEGINSSFDSLSITRNDDNFIKDESEILENKESRIMDSIISVDIKEDFDISNFNSEIVGSPQPITNNLKNIKF